MNKVSLLASAIALATASTQLHAEQITGLITNEQGQLVSGATVKVMGTNKAVQANESGI